MRVPDADFLGRRLVVAGCNKSKSPEDVSKDVANAEQKANNEVKKSEDRAQSALINHTKRSATRNQIQRRRSKPTMWPSPRPITAKSPWRLAVNGDAKRPATRRSRL